MCVSLLTIFFLTSAANAAFLQKPADATAIQPAVTAATVPQSALAMSSDHSRAAGPAPAPVFPLAPATAQDHAMAAQQSADEAKNHLQAAQAALAKTKKHVEETLKTGKKIESTAGDIKELYTPPKPATEPLIEAELELGNYKEQQTSYVGRMVAQLIFAILYYFIIVKKYPILSANPTEEAVELQQMHEVLATTRASLPNCILSWCCTGPRAAHTFHTAGVMNYWPGCILMSLFPCCTLWAVNSFMPLNEKLGGSKRNAFMGLISACFCSCCVVAQDAQALDLIAGVKTGFCGVSK